MPSPETDGYGWVLGDDCNVDILWISGPTAPQAVLSCKCRRACELPMCECLVNGLRCTEECRLKECANMQDDTQEDSFTDGYAADDESDSDEN